MTQDRKRSRVSITDDTRKAIRDHYASCNPRPTQRAIMKWFEDNFHQRLSQSTISDILSHKFSYLDNTTGGPSKRHRRSLHPILDQALYDWYQISRAHNAEVTGEIMKHTAVKLWENLPEYKGIPCPELDGWINSFKKRHNIFLRRWVYSHRDASQPLMELPSSSSGPQLDPSLGSLATRQQGDDPNVQGLQSPKSPSPSVTGATRETTTHVTTNDRASQQQHVPPPLLEESPSPSAAEYSEHPIAISGDLTNNKSRSVRRWIQLSGNGQVTAIASGDQELSGAELPPATDLEYGQQQQQQQQQQHSSVPSSSNFVLQQNIANAALQLTLARYSSGGGANGNHKPTVNGSTGLNTIGSPVIKTMSPESDITSEKALHEQQITLQQAQEAVKTLIQFEQEHKDSADGRYHQQIKDALGVCKEWLEQLGEKPDEGQQQTENSSSKS